MERLYNTRISETCVLDAMLRVLDQTPEQVISLSRAPWFHLQDPRLVMKIGSVPGSSGSAVPLTSHSGNRAWILALVLTPTCGSTQVRCSRFNLHVSLSNL